MSTCQKMQVRWKDCIFYSEKLPSHAAVNKLGHTKLFGISFQWTLNFEIVS